MLRVNMLRVTLSVNPLLCVKPPQLLRDLSEPAQLSNQAISLSSIFLFFLLHVHLVVQT